MTATLGCINLVAGTETFDFETDIIQDERLTVYTTQPDYVWQDGQSRCGAARVCATGQSSLGFLSLTEATNNTDTTVIFPELDSDQAVEAFRVTVDLRIGNGGTDRSGDGFSLSFARAGDPVLLSEGAGGFYNGYREAGV